MKGSTKLQIEKILIFFLTNQLKIELILTISVLNFLLCIEVSNAWQNILLGVLSSLLLVVVFNIIQAAKDYSKFNYLVGKFKRIRFYEFNQSAQDTYVERSNYYKSLDEHITFKYRGSGVFTGRAEYSEGIIYFEISLDPLNPSMGKGSYRYITEGDNDRALQNLDFGTYSLFKYSLNNIDYVILYHENVVPSKKSAGYELLQNVISFDNSVDKIKIGILKKRKLRIKLSNSHNYTNSKHYMNFWPYKLFKEVKSGDLVVFGHVEYSLSGFNGETVLSVPFISKIELLNEKFKRDPHERDKFNGDNLELVFPAE